MSLPRGTRRAVPPRPVSPRVRFGSNLRRGARAASARGPFRFLRQSASRGGGRPLWSGTATEWLPPLARLDCGRQTVCHVGLDPRGRVRRRYRSRRGNATVQVVLLVPDYAGDQGGDVQSTRPTLLRRPTSSLL